jgi:hypothetical protein
MKERPIIFNAAMVNAILSGQKTQTRRIIKPAPAWVMKSGVMSFKGRVGLPHSICPYGQIEDRLWVRETIDGIWGCDASYMADDTRLADVLEGWWDEPQRLPIKRIPSIHMPRWASRITLEITDLRVERLQDISEEDAKAEGVPLDCPIGNIKAYQKAPYSYCFAQLWESINGEGSWDANPWVWVISFKKVEK